MGADCVGRTGDWGGGLDGIKVEGGEGKLERRRLGSRSQTLKWEVPMLQAPASHVREPKNRCLSASGTS